MSTPAAPWHQHSAMNGTKAFTTVHARRALGGATQQAIPTPPPENTTPKKIDWPQSVREYVQRSFDPERSIPGIEKIEMEGVLKRLITEAAETNSLNDKDWENMPLPQELIQMERARAMERSKGASAPQAFADNQLPFIDSSRKRKSPDTDRATSNDASLRPWQRTNTNNPPEDRITGRAQSDHLDKRVKKKQEELGKGSSKYDASLERRKQRFENGKNGYSSQRPWSTTRDDSPVAETGPVIGISQELEKKYLRLTAPPKPSTVRPLHVLQQTLELLKTKWRLENNYAYICDQFKSLRQDVTVQHIKTDFTVSVYEIHARIALEQGDLGEYNQCQTQLRALYSQGLKGRPAEFLAYRILYFIYTCNTTGMNDVLADLTAADKAQPAVKHALDVRSSIALENYHKFFRLYLNTPNMGAYLLDKVAPRERLAALANICKAYKTDLKIRFLTEELGFDSDPDCVHFLVDHGGEPLLTQKDDGVYIMPAKAGPVFETARKAAFQKWKDART